MVADRAGGAGRAGAGRVPGARQHDAARLPGAVAACAAGLRAHGHRALPHPEDAQRVQD